MEPFKAKPPRKKKIRETGRGGTEQAGRAVVQRFGGESWKWVSPGMNGVPDQIELYGVNGMAELLGAWLNLDAEESRQKAVELLATVIQFTEYKAPNKTPTPNQLRVHERLRARGFTVNVVDYKKVLPK